MRSNAIIPLLLAQVALGASLPIVLEDEMQAALLVSPAQHPPAPVGTRPAQLRPEGQEEEDPFADEDFGDAPAQKSFDNQPIMPSATDKPSAVLEGPHPIETAWLLALTGPTPAPSRLPLPDALMDPEEEAEYVAAMIAELEVSRGQRTPPSRLESTPCQYAAYLSREYRDMLVISLFVTFVVVIVLAEMWEKVLVSRREAAAAAAAASRGSIRLEEGDEEAVESRRRKWRIADLVHWQRMRVLMRREGAIRLEDDETTTRRRPTEISIRASEPEPNEPAELDAIDEKTELLL